MENPGNYTPVALDITTALTASAQTAIDDLDGMERITLVAMFAYGSGGATCFVLVQITPDGGVTWLDLARFDFTTASARKWCVLTKDAKTIAAYAALAVEGINQSLVCGDKLRGVVTSTSTYVNTTLTLRADVT